MARVYKIVDGLWISNAHILSRLHRFPEIGTFLSLRMHQAAIPNMLHVEMEDGKSIRMSTLDDVYAIIDRLRADGILVISDQGISRAPAIVAGQLMREGMNMEKALAEIQRVSPNICPHPVLLESVQQWVHTQRAFPFLHVW